MSSFPLQHILFLDIETVSQFPSYNALPDEWKELWDTKSNALARYHEGETHESLYPRAAIYAEFGRVICISCGLLQGTGHEKKFLLKSFWGEDERVLLAEFSAMLAKWSSGEPKFLCAHNGKEFDFPYLCRRMIINRLPVPGLLNSAGKKPWETGYLDTMEWWKFGDFKNYTSLHLLARTLGIPTPKDDIDGSKVGELYWSAMEPAGREASLLRIVNYCQKDVTAVAQVFLRIHGEEIIAEENIQIK